MGEEKIGNFFFAHLKLACETGGMTRRRNLEKRSTKGLTDSGEMLYDTPRQRALECRSMVGLPTLDRPIGVRIPALQPAKREVSHLSFFDALILWERSLKPASKIVPTKSGHRTSHTMRCDALITHQMILMVRIQRVDMIEYV